MIVPVIERLSHLFDRAVGNPGLYSKVYASHDAKGRVTETTWVMGELDITNDRYTLFNCSYRPKGWWPSYRKEEVSRTFSASAAVEAVAEVEFNMQDSHLFSEVKNQPFKRNPQLENYELPVNTRLGASRR